MTGNAGMRAKVKKKMTKEQMQLAIIKKKESDLKALLIVERLLEPQIESEWLLNNLIHINKCHMEDVIEERAIIKLCGYVLCPKPLTVIINQRYHISLKNKKVYDVTKRKHFCSSKCFGASNYLLEQIPTSPLWLRDKEEVPKFRIFSQDNSIPSVSHGEELDIAIIDHCLKNESQDKKDTNISTKDIRLNEFIHKDDFNDNVCKAVKNKHIDKADLKVNAILTDANAIKSNDEVNVNNEIEANCNIKEIKDILEYVGNKFDETNINKKQVDNAAKHIPAVIENVNLQNIANCDKKLQDSTNKCSSEKATNDKSHKHYKKLKHKEKLRQVENKASIEINLATKVEASFKEWITEETINFLFGADSIKKETIENIERQDKYSILCKKLYKLQFQDHQIIKPSLKPVPHFTILQEEGQKLNLKVKGFQKETNVIEKPEPMDNEQQPTRSNTVLPLIDTQAPNIFRRKIFLDRLDQILPELLKTLAGNNEVYARTCCNYTSVRCTAIKALIHTFSLSAKNIIFKNVEWTLVGLIIIKMLSLLDPWLTSLLSSQQANMYISMILTSYKLDPDYLNLLIASFNLNINN
ncbi:PREDICTED: LOW QUALITY PROTEIN: putative RNA polymerase II subunit B1 CTD phosphatase RPAP2 [Ceratosolen solmsi marchali]|uniref:RNA polymerase II subunit B1 CTD phosphatase RPAP2 homolog n=1 Tax=Ceratosolen solmsi marchali TaxID=326594 RepID=A0AAJ6VMW3_9HYME|nr:PREDICTED: LOW QUALITY PROTEIN: putative RNA polymerase II subunit B1 CTD phosphatase RPAP2 [Ceratosolen solmsi marchali]